MSVVTPPRIFINDISDCIADFLSDNPAATSSEAYVQHHIEFQLLKKGYALRSGINYHGGKVQETKLNNNILNGWNPNGDALGTGDKAKLLLSGYTIVERDPNEHNMSDSKFSEGSIPNGQYIRVEYKCRGWLGKTKNLDGKQLLKDIGLLQDEKADLLVICLSETAHKKWRGEGDEYQASRRTGTDIFRQLLADTNRFNPHNSTTEDQITFNGQSWTINCKKIIGDINSIMPGAEHYITMCWRN